jgi:hypothetical protein
MGAGSPIWPKLLIITKLLQNWQNYSIWKRNSTCGLCWTPNKYIYSKMKGIENNNHYKVVTKSIKFINLQKYKQSQVSLRKSDMDYIINHWILNK